MWVWPRDFEHSKIGGNSNDLKLIWAQQKDGRLHSGACNDRRASARHSAWRRRDRRRQLWRSKETALWLWPGNSRGKNQEATCPRLPQNSSQDSAGASEKGPRLSSCFRRTGTTRRGSQEFTNLQEQARNALSSGRDPEVYLHKDFPATDYSERIVWRVSQSDAQRFLWRAKLSFVYLWGHKFR